MSHGQLFLIGVAYFSDFVDIYSGYFFEFAELFIGDARLEIKSVWTARSEDEQMNVP